MEMSFRNIKIDFILPLFLGLFGSLFLCAVIGMSYGIFVMPEIDDIVENETEEVEYDFIFSASDKVPDPILEYYRNPDYMEWVIDFFADICSNYAIAMAILSSTDNFNVPPALAFALCWEESRFNPNAINRNNRDESIDRGLFQLNSRSFPHLETTVFYNIYSNAHYGVGHLRFCLDSGASEISALAMYNAGTGRVRSIGAPEVTLNYISRILENRAKIESRFHSKLMREEEARLAEDVSDEKDKEETARQPFFNMTFTPTSPL